MNKCLLIVLLVAAAVAPGVEAAGTRYFLKADFDAECDGAVNDHDEIQTALNTIKNGDILEFPAGETCFTRTILKINGGTGFVIEGNGATLLSSIGEGGLIIKHSNGFEIRDLTFDGNRDLDCSQTPIPDGCACVDCLDDNLIIRGSTPVGVTPQDPRPPSLLTRVRGVNSARDGIHIKGYSMDLGGNIDPTENISLVDCDALDNSRNGLTIAEARNARVVGGLFARSGDDLPGAGIDIESELDQLDRDIEVTGATLSDNFGNGIQITQGVIPGAVVEQVRVIDNEFFNNQRGAIRNRATQVTIAGNRFHDFSFSSGVTQEATITLFEQSQDILIAGNSLSDIETGLPVVWVENKAERVEVSHNLFDTINTISGTGAAVQMDAVGGLVAQNQFMRIATGAATGPAVFFETTAADGAIVGNEFFDIGPRALWTTSPRALISDNVFECGRKNVIWAAGEDSLIEGNVLGPLAEAGSSTAADSVIRYRKSGGLVAGNSLTCIDATPSVQRGLLLDLHPTAVLDNSVAGCDPNKQIQYLAGLDPLLTVDRGNTTSGVGSAQCDPNL
ncbi:MAG: right-handed parallel beta-helix repeat-containing protein [Deltaproteobacteria bacterium]|nr:right-handed parallel beta-helix repeat-containing protein [Deltaproteobacteria bacterium]